MNPISRAEHGFSLVELAMALAITAFCLIAIFGLLPVGLTSNQNAIEQTAAAGIATGIVSDLRASGTNTQSQAFGLSLTTTSLQTIYFTESEAATSVGAGPNNNGTSPSRYRASVYLTPPATAGQRTATVARVLITWPAFADPAPATAPKNYAGSFEIATALDRN